MKIIFLIFTMFIFYLAELYIGTAGIYFPFGWMAFFYFNNTNCNKTLLYVLGISGALIADTVLFERNSLPDIFILAAVIFLSHKYRNFWRSAIRHGALFAFILLPLGYLVQYAALILEHGFSLDGLTAALSQMTVLSPLAFALLAGVIFVLDALQKKFKSDQLFIESREKTQLNIYRRTTGKRADD